MDTDQELTVRRALLIFSAAMCLLLTGCGASSGTGRVTALTLWARSDESAFIQGVVSAFNKSHPQIRIKLTVIPVNNFVQKFGIAVAGNSGPDLASIDVVYLPLFASTGVLTDLTARAHQLPYFDQFDQSHINNATYRGRLYGLPFSGDASVLFYNTTLFRDAGLNPDKPPQTWTAVEQDAQRVAASGGGRSGYYFAGDCGGCAVFTFLPLIWASHGNILEGPATAQRPTLTDPAVLAALRFYRSMWSAHLVPVAAQTDSGTSQFTPFESGKVAMFTTGGFGVQTLHQDAPNVPLAATPIPGQDGGSASFAGGDEIAIARSSHHQQAAWQFIQWVTSASVQQQYFGNTGVIPIRRDVAFRDYAPKNSIYRLLAKELFSGRAVYSVQENALINDPTGPWVTMIDNAVFTGHIRSAVTQAESSMKSILSRG
ncbi:MAG: sugar ABC transporter substrate-binding protein [Solirubrobacterales bacterium]|nr:sugar ABC transporter substrate-binding protein [Solirubrobacterales bacterium]